MEPLAVREPEARRILGGISRETLWRLRKSGRIESYTIGAARFFPMDALHRFVAEQRASTRSGPKAARHPKVAGDCEEQGDVPAI